MNVLHLTPPTASMGWVGMATSAEADALLADAAAWWGG